MSNPEQDRIRKVFSGDGALGKLIDGYSPRPQQLEMTLAVADALRSGTHLICEAGTGIGKTLAYLIPALLFDRRTIISTSTRHLQDQLYLRDLPLARTALHSDAQVVRLKGRSNYLCLYRLDQSPGRLQLLPAPSRIMDAGIASVQSWAMQTSTGDTEELDTLAEESPVWKEVTSTRDNCLGQNCPRINDCYVFKARRKASAADIVVVNHHLLMADLALKKDGYGRLLPGAEVVIVDEAHQLPDTATRFLGLTLTSAHLRALAKDAELAVVLEAPEASELIETARMLGREVSAVHHRMPPPQSLAWELLGETAIADYHAFTRQINALADALEVHAERGTELANCAKRAREDADQLQAIVDADNSDWARWLDISDRGFSWQASPLDVSVALKSQIKTTQATWIFTSATLAVEDNMDHFANRIGLPTARTAVYGSPFDYPRQVLCVCPLDFPLPGSKAHSLAVIALVREAIAASGGRAFVLFSSHQALHKAAQALRHTLAFPVLVQGDAPRHQLLHRFRTQPGSVLLGTASFREGVDVRGDALSLIVIDKLTFASPDDPLLQARSRALKQQGRNPFLELQLPQAVIALKQAVGRLIRDSADRGVVVIGDVRLYTRAYGRVFLRSLPPMASSRNRADIGAFFAPQLPPPKPTGTPTEP